MLFRTARITSLRVVIRGGEEHFVIKWGASKDEFRDVLAALKAEIEPYMRKWDPDTKTWWINGRYSEELGKTFRNFDALEQARKNQMTLNV